MAVVSWGWEFVHILCHISKARLEAGLPTVLWNNEVLGKQVTFQGTWKHIYIQNLNWKACDIRNIMKCVKCVFIHFFIILPPTHWYLKSLGFEDIILFFGTYNFSDSLCLKLIWQVPYGCQPLHLQMLQFFSKDALFHLYQAWSNPFLKAQLKSLFFQEDFPDLVLYFITSLSLSPPSVLNFHKGWPVFLITCIFCLTFMLMTHLSC